MAKSKNKRKKKRKAKKVRCYEALFAILNCKGGPHKDRRDKRNKRNKQWIEDAKD